MTVDSMICPPSRTSWYLHRHIPDLDITVVELDPDVVELAAKYFNVFSDRNYRIAIDDGRKFLMKDKRVYDLIFLDAHRGPYIPFHLLTQEFYQLVRAHLAPRGVVVHNTDPTAMLFESAVATLATVFAQQDFFHAGQNTIIVAYDGRRKTAAELERRAIAVQGRYNFKYPPRDLLKHRFDYTAPNSAKLLTDDFAPVNALRAIRRHNHLEGRN